MKKTIRATRTCAWMIFLALALCSATTLHAQEARGTIAGTVRDASKSVVPGAIVKVTNVAMGTTVTTETNDAGLYQAPYLIPGTYQIAIEVTGFKKYIRDGIVLRVNDKLELDADLEVGTVDQSVTITSDAPALDTASASLGRVVDARRIAELPIGHGDPYALIGLAGGVSFTRSSRLDRPFEPTHIVGYSIDGTRSNRSDLTIDGASSTSTANAGEVISSFVPPQDIVQEFKVQTATFDAQFGNTEGGVTNLSIKSGTNNLHGTLYYSNFTPGTSANDFYDNRQLPLPGETERHITDFFYHRYGGTVGGPVWVPKLYSGKNRTFFMYGVEGIYEARPRNNGTFQIPTQKMRGGDFSDFLAIGPTYQLYNPFSARAEGGRIRRDPFMCDAAGNALAPLANRTQPAGTACNKIPAALINPIARNFVDNFLPLPTSAATAADGTGNFQQADLKETAKYQSHTIRIDHVVSDKQRIFARASWYDRNSDYNNYYRNIATGEYFSFISRQMVVDDVYTFTPTLVLNVRYGYNRFIRVTNSNPGNRGFDLTSLGFPASYANLIPDNLVRFPRFDINSYQGTGIGGEYRPTDTHNFVGVVNKSLGAHSLKGGVEFRSYRETSGFFGNNQTGLFTFDNTYVRGPLDNSTAPTQLGFSFASFLLGIPSSGSINQPADYAEQSTTTGIFLHDDWKVNSKLTLNLGLRYEVEGALTERFNRSISGIDPFFVQPFEAAARTAFANAQGNAATATPEVTQFNVRGGLLFAGVNGEPRGLYKTPRSNYMPRIGLAYKLNDKTVLRAGYGIFFGFLGQRRGDVIQSGYSTSTPLNVTLNNGLTFLETLSNPFQTGLQSVLGSSQGAQTFVGQSITFFNPHPQSPYNQRWQLGIQRELPWGFVAEASYVGNRGTHAEINRNINATSNQFLATGPQRNQTRIDYLSALVPNPFFNLLPTSAGGVFRSATIARERLLRPFPQFDAVTTTTNDGYSWYHSGQFSLEKRFSRGYTLQASYTYSKFMEAVEYLNGADPRPTEVISPEDRPHRLAVSGIYELPFGKGRALLGNVNSVASLFVSGWQVSGIYTLQSGPPLGFGNIAYFGDPKDIRLPGDKQGLTQWINTTGFVALRAGNTIIRDSSGNPVWVDFNDPCKTTYNATSCPGTPLTTLRGFNRDATLQPGSNVRTFPNRFGFIRAQKINNFDFGFIKKTAIGESKEIQFRAEFLNSLNHPLFFTTQINLTPNQAAFGQVTAGTQENYPRRVQLTFKFVF